MATFKNNDLHFSEHCRVVRQMSDEFGNMEFIIYEEKNSRFATLSLSKEEYKALMKAGDSTAVEVDNLFLDEKKIKTLREGNWDSGTSTYTDSDTGDITQPVPEDIQARLDKLRNPESKSEDVVETSGTTYPK